VIDVFSHLPDGAVVLDAEGRITAANPAAGALAKAPGLVGRGFDEAVGLRDGDGNAWWGCTRRLRAMRGVRGVPPRVLDLDGRPVELAATFLRDAAGNCTGAVVSLRDASARRRFETGQAELVSTLAHELRSPLTSVKGFSATLLARWERFNDEQKLHMLTTINADADRVTRLIRELLDVSRIDSGRLEVNRRMVELPKLAQLAAERLATGETPVETAFPDGFPDVYADPEKLDQVLTYLLEYAVRHATGSVSLTATTADDAVEVGVRAPGPGLPDTELRRVFAKFAGDHPGARGGTGLGLYIAKGIVEAHGGKVMATSAPGHGTELRFRLPRGGLELAGIE
jgi:signal transduction histidine kinase